MAQKMLDVLPDNFIDKAPNYLVIFSPFDLEEILQKRHAANSALSYARGDHLGLNCTLKNCAYHYIIYDEEKDWEEFAEKGACFAPKNPYAVYHLFVHFNPNLIVHGDRMELLAEAVNINSNHKHKTTTLSYIRRQLSMKPVFSQKKDQITATREETVSVENTHGNVLLRSTLFDQRGIKDKVDKVLATENALIFCKFVDFLLYDNQGTN